MIKYQMLLSESMQVTHQEESLKPLTSENNSSSSLRQRRHAVDQPVVLEQCVARL